VATREETYLFIDGEYLRQLYRDAMQSFCGFDGELFPARLRHESIAYRAFFYDSLDDAQRAGELESAFLARVAEQEKFFDEIRSISGFHVRLGSVTGKKRRRQKEVDVLLAVDMLTHGLAGNMKKAILLAGDLDFRPIVESLVQRGVFLEVWFERKSAAKELYGAADFGREMPFSEIHSLGRPSFQKAHSLPSRSMGGTEPQGKPSRVGHVGSELVSLFHAGVNEAFHLWVPHLRLMVSDSELSRIERLMEMEYEPVVWDRAEQREGGN
jgi:hypothetical protein